MYVCVCVFVSVRVCAHGCVYANAGMYVHMPACAGDCRYACACPCACTCSCPHPFVKSTPEFPKREAPPLAQNAPTWSPGRAPSNLQAGVRVGESHPRLGTHCSLAFLDAFGCLFRKRALRVLRAVNRSPWFLRRGFAEPVCCTCLRNSTHVTHPNRPEQVLQTCHSPVPRPAIFNICFETRGVEPPAYCTANSCHTQPQLKQTDTTRIMPPLPNSIEHAP